MEITDPEALIKKLKSAYIAIDPPVSLKEEGFLTIKGRLSARGEPVQPAPFLKIVWSRPALAPAFITFLLLLILVSPAVLASLPGEIFYPAKRLIEDISAVVYPSKTRATFLRAEEVVRLSSQNQVKNSPVLRKTVEEYKLAVIEASHEAQVKEEKKEELRRGLSRQRESFSLILKESKTPTKELKEALETAERALGVISAPPTLKEEKKEEETPPARA